MRRNLARVTAAAVTGLFLGGSAAQGQAPRTPAAVTHAPTPYAVAAAPVTAEAPDRFTEISVELAWLTDPVTFPCRLAARATPAGLEVRGFVPSDVVRERALKLAQQNCDRPLIDGIQVHGAMAAHTPGVPLEQMRPAVEAALRTASPTLASRITAQYRSYGQVVLTGAVPSLEDKLALSQALRCVPGCRSVVNQLQVGMAAAPQVAAAPRPLAGTPMGPTASAPRSEFNRSMPPAPLAARPETPQPPPSLPPYGAAPGGPALKQVGFTGPEKPAVTSPAMPRLETWQPSRSAEPKAPSAPQQLKTPAPSAPLLPVLERTSERPGQAPGVTFATLPSKAIPAHPASPPPVKSASVLAPAPLPPAVPAPAPVQKAAPAPARAPGEPYVSTGMVLIDAEPSAEEAIRVHEAVERACAGKARDIETVSDPDGGMVIRLRAASKADADWCNQRVRRLPEVAPYGTKLRLAISVPE